MGQPALVDGILQQRVVFVLRKREFKRGKRRQKRCLNLADTFQSASNTCTTLVLTAAANSTTDENPHRLAISLFTSPSHFSTAPTCNVIVNVYTYGARMFKRGC